MDFLSLTDIVSSIENLSDSTQLFLKKALKDILFGTKRPIVLTECSEKEELLSLGVLAETSGKYELNEKWNRNAKKLYSYLSRKFDKESYLDPETFEPIDIPKGSTFVCEMGIASGENTLFLQFPDDEVTALLDLFDSNPCKYWNK